MKKLFVRFFSNIVKSSDTEHAMSRGRFFVNTYVDLAIGQKTKPLADSSLKPTINEIVSRITTKFKPILKNADDGLYLGTAGVAYMFYHLSKIEELQEFREGFISQAIEYLTPALQVSNKSTIQKQDIPAFLLGNGGVYAVAAAIYHAANQTTESEKYRNLYIDAGMVCKNLQFLSCGSDELFVGRAGYLCGALWLENEINMKFPIEDLFELCRLMIESGRIYAHRHGSPSPLMYAYYNVEYLGAGHGLCSILLYIMMVPGYLDANPKDARDIKACINYLLSLQDKDGNFPTAMDEVGADMNDLVHWCHGASGIAYLLAKAYLVWHEDKHLDGLVRASDLIWQKGLLKKGPGLCHGIAGNGYVFLLLYRLTSDSKYLHRANSFFEFMYTDEFLKKARIPDNPYSLYEGLAGTACFVADLLEPEKADFPFTNVFS